MTILGCLNKTNAFKPNISTKEEPLVAFAGLQAGIDKEYNPIATPAAAANIN